MRRLSLIVTTVLLSVCAGCVTDGVTAATLVPALPLLDGTAAEPRIEARLEPASITNVGDGTFAIAVRVTSGLSGSVSSGACVGRVDARRITGGQWVDATPDVVTCPSILVLFPQGTAQTIYATANQSVVRALAGGSGRRVLLRVRHVVSSNTVAYLMQSAEQEIVAP